MLRWVIPLMGEDNMERIHIGEEEVNDNWLHSMRDDIQKGGVGSGIKGHRTSYPEKLKKMSNKGLEKEFQKVLEMKRDSDASYDNYDILGIWYSGISMDIYDKIATKTLGLKNEYSRPMKMGHEDTKFTINNMLGVKRTYEITQEVLRRKYPDGKITLYRGLDSIARKSFEERAKNDKVDMSIYNLSSWSSEESVSQFFKDNYQDRSGGEGVVVSATFNIKDILLSPELSKKHKYVANNYLNQMEHIVVSKTGVVNVGVKL